MMVKRYLERDCGWLVRINIPGTSSSSSGRLSGQEENQTAQEQRTLRQEGRCLQQLFALIASVNTGVLLSPMNIFVYQINTLSFRRVRVMFQEMAELSRQSLHVFVDLLSKATYMKGV